MLSLVTFRSIHRTLIIQSLMVLVQYTIKPFVSSSFCSCWMNVVRLVEKEKKSAHHHPGLRFCRKTLLHTQETLSRIWSHKKVKTICLLLFGLHHFHRSSYLRFKLPSFSLSLSLFDSLSFGRATLPTVFGAPEPTPDMANNVMKRKRRMVVVVVVVMKEESSESNWAGGTFRCS